MNTNKTKAGTILSSERLGYNKQGNPRKRVCVNSLENGSIFQGVVSSYENLRPGLFCSFTSKGSSVTSIAMKV